MGIEVIEVEFIDAEELFTQSHVIIHIVHIIVDGLNKVSIDLDGDFVIFKGGLK